MRERLFASRFRVARGMGTLARPRETPFAMAHVVTERCVNCRYTYCAVACPVNCFWEITNPHMLVIDPNTCIDCEACVPECPINAIWPDHELPAAYASWTDFNAKHF